MNLHKTHKRILLLIIIIALLGAACTRESTPEPMEPVATDTPAVQEPTEPVTGRVITGTAQVESIELNIMESFPVQVSVTAYGNLPDGCTKISRTAQARDRNTLLLSVFTERPADVACTEALVPFVETFPLDVNGLDAGTYTVNVNGVITTFELAVDNVISEEPSPPAQEGLNTYLNEADGYRLLYPPAFEASSPQPGTLLFIGPALDQGVEPLRASLIIQNEGAANGRTAKEVADEHLGEFEAKGVPIVRELVNLGGEEAITADGVPGRTLVRQAFVVHNETVYVLTLAPVDADFPQATQEAKDLWTAIVPSFTFIERREAGATEGSTAEQTPVEKDAYAGWTLYEFDDLGVRLYAPPDWTLTRGPGLYGLAPAGSDTLYLLTVSFMGGVPAEVQADSEALADYLTARIREQGESGFVASPITVKGLDGVLFTGRANLCLDTYVPAYGQVIQISLAASGCDADGNVTISEFQAITASIEFYEPR